MVQRGSLFTWMAFIAASKKWNEVAVGRPQRMAKRGESGHDDDFHLTASIRDDDKNIPWPCAISSSFELPSTAAASKNSEASCSPSSHPFWDLSLSLISGNNVTLCVHVNLSQVHKQRFSIQ